MKKILIFTLLTIASVSLRSQVFPSENCSVNYSIIGFSFPANKDAHLYHLEIARGNYFSEDSFSRNIILSPAAKSNNIIAQVPSFGTSYTWRIVYTGKHKTTTKGELHHFNTVMNDRVDTTKMRLNILHPAEAHKNDYVFAEGSGVIYDMNGNPVWCIPDAFGPIDKANDLKLTPQGTLTFLVEQTGYEINYKGEKLWQTPLHDPVSGDTGADYYHHEFTRLSNGHYMILGTQYVWYKRNTVKDSGYFNVTTDISKHTKYNGGFGMKNRGRFGVLVEFDEQGNVVWSWKSLDYLQKSDCVNYWPKDTSLRYEPHENAFYFDEKNNAIYLSYRQLSRIIKINYPGGDVSEAYGELFKAGQPSIGNGVFCNQHSIRLSHDGHLFLFNNNVCSGPGTFPSIVMMNKTSQLTTTLPASPVIPEKTWEYKCSVDDGPTDDKYIGGGFPSGGLAIDLADGSMFIAMGSDYPKLLIVDHEKKLLWDALPEKYDTKAKKWAPVKKTYRANIITREQLETLVWNATKKQGQ